LGVLGFHFPALVSRFALFENKSRASTMTRSGLVCYRIAKKSMQKITISQKCKLTLNSLVQKVSLQKKEGRRQQQKADVKT